MPVLLRREGGAFRSSLLVQRSLVRQVIKRWSISAVISRFVPYSTISTVMGWVLVAVVVLIIVRSELGIRS